MLPDIRPGNTKILYFFNCLLDGMHTTVPYICDFSFGGLNVRLSTNKIAARWLTKAATQQFCSIRIFSS